PPRCIAMSGAKSQSHDSKAELRRLPSLFTQEGPEDRPQAQPRDLQDARGRAEARARGAVLQAGRLAERVRSALAAVEDRLDVHDRRAVDRLDRADAQARTDDPPYGDGVEPERVRTVGRARCEDAREPAAPVVARVDLQHVALASVQPGDDEDLVARLQSSEPGTRARFRLARVRNPRTF